MKYWYYIIFIIILIIKSSAKSPYEILGLKDQASISDVKKAFRQLSLKYHPDKNKSLKAEKTYKEITNAYQQIISGDTQETSKNQYYYGSQKNGYSYQHYEDLFNQKFRNQEEFTKNKQSHHSYQSVDITSFFGSQIVLFLILFIICYFLSNFVVEQTQEDQKKNNNSQKREQAQQNDDKNTFKEKVNSNIKESYDSQSGYDRRAQFWQNLIE